MKNEFNVSYKLFKNIDIYVVRIAKRINKETKESEYYTAMSKPCKHCLAFMQSIGIRKVYYSVNEKEWACESVNKMTTTHCSHANRTYQ